MTPRPVAVEPAAYARQIRDYVEQQGDVNTMEVRCEWLLRIATLLESVPAPTERSQEKPFGDAVGPPWQRGELRTETVRLAEMACCGFRFDAVHTDADGRLTCPLCEPSAPAEREPSEAAIEAAIATAHHPPGMPPTERDWMAAILRTAFHAQFGPTAPSGEPTEGT